MRPEAWTVSDSEIIVADRWIRLRADTCVDAAGRTIAPVDGLDERLSQSHHQLTWIMALPHVQAPTHPRW